MTFVTLEYGATELQLADWNIRSATLDETNQMADKFTCDILQPMDADSPFPLLAKVIIRIGRIAPTASDPNTGLPDATGNTTWSGGKTMFVGYLNNSPARSGASDEEKLTFTFDCPWKTFFEDLIYRMLYWSYNQQLGAEYADWRGQVILGQSVNALVGQGDTIPDTSATNLLSIRQQVNLIVQYAMNAATLEYGSPQFQFDELTFNGTSGNYNLFTTPGDNKLVIPDFIAGTALEVTGATPFTPNYGPYNTLAGDTPDNGTSVVGAAGANLTLITQLQLRAPLNSVNNITCADALRYEIKWLGPMGDIAVWFDYTTKLDSVPCPTLNICTRDQLPSLTLPFPNAPTLLAATLLTGPNGPMLCNASKARRLDNLIPTAVDLEFRINSTVDGQQLTTVTHDIAGTIDGTWYEGIGLPGALQNMSSYFTADVSYVGGSLNSAPMQALQAAGRTRLAVNLTIDMQGNSTKLASCTIATVPVDLSTPSAGSGSAYNFWVALLPELASITTPDFFAGSSVTVIDDNGDTVDTSTYQYLLTDGQIAPWMLAGNALTNNAAAAKQCTITATFIGTENNDTVPMANVVNHLKTARATLVTVPGGLYQQQIPIGFAEIVPYGLAGYIYNYASIPQYEGTYTIQETEITDQCPMGNNLNLSGGRTEWATMNACLQQISYDLIAGKTSITYGAAKHLGPAELSKRLQVNNGPRWYNLNGNNVTNDTSQNSTPLGNNVAQRGPSPGPRATNWQHHPIDVADELTNTGDYTYGTPGIHLDNRSDPPPNYGAVPGSSIAAAGLEAPDEEPTIFLADGVDGALGRCIRISTAELPLTWQAFFQEVSLTLADGTCSSGYVLLALPPP